MLWKATKEIHHAMEPDEASKDLLNKNKPSAVEVTFGAVIAQIIALDLVFSVDSILTAVGMTDQIPIMVTAVVITVGIMLVAADPLAKFIEKNPTLVMLRQCAADVENEDETDEITKQRIRNMLQFVTTTSDWYEEIQAVPTSTLQKLMKLVDALEDDDDVQRVTTNFEASDEVLAQL